MGSARPIAEQSGLSADAIALTFDDGPAEWTEPILDVLRMYRAYATFFVIGDAIPGREQTLRRAAAEGHEIANHTATHPRLDLLQTEVEIERELQLGSRAIEDVLGARPTQFRPPGFRYDARVLEVAGRFGYEWAVLASVAMADYNMASSKKIAKKTLRRVRAGSIIALHDGRPLAEPSRSAGGSLDDRSAVVGAIREIVPTLTERGYRLCTVSDFLAL